MTGSRKLLADAPPDWAEAALLVFVEGLTHAEAARAMDVSSSTVGNLCKRFVNWARPRMGPPAESET